MTLLAKCRWAPRSTHRFTHHGNLHLQLEAARLALCLLGGVFACSLVHPQRPVDLAACTLVELWPGLGQDVWADPYTGGGEGQWGEKGQARNQLARTGCVA